MLTSDLHKFRHWHDQKQQEQNTHVCVCVRTHMHTHLYTVFLGLQVIHNDDCFQTLRV